MDVPMSSAAADSLRQDAEAVLALHWVLPQPCPISCPLAGSHPLKTTSGNTGRIIDPIALCCLERGCLEREV